MPTKRHCTISNCDATAQICNIEMEAGALHAIQQLLDDGGIPRGTFADDQVRNLVALYNRRGEQIERLKRKIKRLEANQPS